MVRLKQFLKKDVKVASKVLQEEKQKIVEQARATSSNFFMMKQGSLPAPNKDQSKAVPTSLLSLNKTQTTTGYVVPTSATKKVLADMTNTCTDQHSVPFALDSQPKDLLDEVLDQGVDSIHQSLLDSSHPEKRKILRKTMQDLRKGNQFSSSTGQGWRLRVSDKVLSDEIYQKRVKTGEPRKITPSELVWVDLLNNSWELSPQKTELKGNEKPCNSSDDPTPFIPIRLQEYIGLDTSEISSGHDWFLRGKFFIVLKTTK